MLEYTTEVSLHLTTVSISHRHLPIDTITQLSSIIMDTYANSYQAYGNIVGPPISRSGSAFGDTSYRSGNTRHGCGIITAHPPGIERTASVAGSMCDVGTELVSTWPDSHICSA